MNLLNGLETLNFHKYSSNNKIKQIDNEILRQNILHKNKYFFRERALVVRVDVKGVFQFELSFLNVLRNLADVGYL